MKYLGVDWGLKRVGLAFSEGALAAPYKSLQIQGLKDGVQKVIKEMKEIGAESLVMGKPEGEMGKNVERAAKEFSKLGVKVILADETLSTQEAKQLMVEMGMGRKARQDDNSMAAGLILQRFLDEQTK